MPETVRVHVMHMTDTLRAGGTERVAVNLVNVLPREQHVASLCTTREEGPLAPLVASDVRRLRLWRTHRFDSNAVRRLVAFMRSDQTQIIHAHASALFLAVAASYFPPHPAVIWHDHFGRFDTEQRPAWLYRLAARRVSAVIAVNERLAAWSREALGVPPDRVCYVPNFVCAPDGEVSPPTDLPGEPGSRIVCVANFRPQKDHLALLSAMSQVVQRVPSAHLLLAGSLSDQRYVAQVREAMTQLRLEQHVSILGLRQDIHSILRACDIGVLSSNSEGLPLALLEYGMAGLAVVATDVGQCAEVLDHGRAGLIVSAGSPDQLADALAALLRFPERRTTLGERFQRRACAVYGAAPALAEISRIYQSALSLAS